MAVHIEILNDYKPNFYTRTLHYYRYLITLIVFTFRNLVGIPIFASKSFLFKLFDLTLFNKQASIFYLKYPFSCASLIDQEITKELFNKYHRNDPSSIFKGNNVMNRFLEIIQVMYPESNIQANDCILTCDEFHTKIYHAFLHKYLSQQSLQKRKEIIKQNIIKYFGNLDGCSLDLHDVINNYVSDNFTMMLFNKTYTNTNKGKSFSKCCSEINDYIFHNRMSKIMNSTVFNNGSDKKISDTLVDFKEIVNQIIDDNKEIFDAEGFTMTQRQAIVPILLFGGQETTHTLATYVFYALGNSKITKNIIETYRKSNDDKNADKLVDYIFNMCLSESTPAHGTARILKYNTQIRTENGTYVYPANTVIGPMPCFLAEIYKKESMRDYNIIVPFGTGKHRCPGERLVLLEIKELIKYLLINYDIKTDTKKITFKQYMTQKITTKFLTTFNKIKTK
jgi:hypothetical protein